MIGPVIEKSIGLRTGPGQWCESTVIGKTIIIGLPCYTRRTRVLDMWKYGDWKDYNNRPNTQVLDMSVMCTVIGKIIIGLYTRVLGMWKYGDWKDIKEYTRVLDYGIKLLSYKKTGKTIIDLHHFFELRLKTIPFAGIWRLERLHFISNFDST